MEKTHNVMKTRARACKRAKIHFDRGQKSRKRAEVHRVWLGDKTLIG